MKKRTGGGKRALAAPKADPLPGRRSRSVAGRPREVTLPLLLRREPAWSTAAGAPRDRGGRGAVGAGPEEARKPIGGLGRLRCEARLRELGLVSLEKRRLRGELAVALRSFRGPSFWIGPGALGQGGKGFKLKKGKFQFKEEILYAEAGETPNTRSADISAFILSHKAFCFLSSGSSLKTPN